ncbi:hypothetical protein EVAR_89361_1 [Eumeta japonica]|uniref:Uncharacterized protein n=1 Tax=Eumeta variegata TaxID=151549 RepID=A0A4C1Y5M8_EUMVA|nr:hypothetical protein EVAR_89361_1 [Eumeta japonica]
MSEVPLMRRQASLSDVSRIFLLPLRLAFIFYSFARPALYFVGAAAGVMNGVAYDERRPAKGARWAAILCTRTIVGKYCLSSGSIKSRTSHPATNLQALGLRGSSWIARVADDGGLFGKVLPYVIINRPRFLLRKVDLLFMHRKRCSAEAEIRSSHYLSLLAPLTFSPGAGRRGAAKMAKLIQFF